MTDTLDTQATEPATVADNAEPRVATAEPAPAAPAAPDDIAPPLGALITAIRTAVAKGASPEARALGATACRSIATVLEALPGQPMTAAQQPASPAAPIAALLKQPGFLNQLAAMSREQLLGLLRQFTGATPARPQAPASGAPRFHLIQLPPGRRPDGK
jgi:hypothetical protein